VEKRSYFPSIILLIIAFLYLIFTRNNLKEVGLPEIIENKYEFESDGTSENLKILNALLKNQALWIYSSCYMILKMTDIPFFFGFLFN
jgi:OPA family glycerol-3-phosphate transporter-like MFS transporter